MPQPGAGAAQARGAHTSRLNVALLAVILGSGTALAPLAVATSS